jgi:hypothetical protein
MEPLAELATLITSLLWTLHEFFPAVTEAATLLSTDTWKDKLRSAAAGDWAVLQSLQDLADCRGAAYLADSSRDGVAFREWQAEQTLPFLEERIVCLKQKLAEGVTFSLVPHNGAAVSLLTKEELYEKTLTWLLYWENERRWEPLEQIALAFTTAGSPLLLEKEFNNLTDRFLHSKKADAACRAFAETWKSIESDRTARLRILLDRSELRKWCIQLGVAVPFSLVLSDELDEIAKSRKLRLEDGSLDDLSNLSMAQLRVSANIPASLGPPASQAFKSSLFGLALSGGGIRSATFSLGLLQGMADRNILPYIDILSTVSGGGYIGSWLIAWVKRRGSIAAVQRSLQGSATAGIGRSESSKATGYTSAEHSPPLGYVTRNSDPHSDHLRPVRLLRDYARYLAPQAGLLSADTWTIVATWLRNTSLNLIILALFFAALLLAPRVVVFSLSHLRFLRNLPHNELLLPAITLLSALPIFWGCWLIRTRNLNTIGEYFRNWRTQDCLGPKELTRGDDDHGVAAGILPWILFGVLLMLAVFWYYWPLFSFGYRFLSAAVVPAVATLILITLPDRKQVMEAIRKILKRDQTPLQTESIVSLPLLPLLGAAVASGIIGAIPFVGVYWAIQEFAGNTEKGIWLLASAGAGLLLWAISAHVVLLLGLFGNQLSDEHREWWSRAGAWLMLMIGGWLLISAICFFAPLGIALFELRLAAGISWAAITGVGIKIAFGAKSGKDQGSSEQNWFFSALMNIAPTVFVLGFLAIVSLGLFWSIQFYLETVVAHDHLGWSFLIDNPMSHQLCCVEAPASLSRMIGNYWSLSYPDSIAPLFLMIVAGLLCAGVAWRVDINEFSMHNFYKNRLVRAYLGTSRTRMHRYPNAFTGFDLEDDVRLSRFTTGDETQVKDVATDCKISYRGPFPILNTALNITKGAELGMQERKAESFIFTPLWSGFDFAKRQVDVKRTLVSEFAYRRTADFADPKNGGALLGTAMAISGAAFNSNAGFHTSPSLSFLLTVFGVRLGWWAGNPRRRKWEKQSPGLGLMWLLKELVAQTSANQDFVLLSDGGHFENMGLYELVRRRCRFIILSDAEEDEDFKLEGIGGAIRKCRDDFGVVISLNIDALRPLGNPGFSRLHFSVGEILYPGEETAGKLVYIKASVSNDEPLDVSEFRNRHKEFPHTSTTNQFFDESHFESYRQLGHHIAEQIFTTDMPVLPVTGSNIARAVDDLFGHIGNRWEDLLKDAKAKEDVKTKPLNEDDPEKSAGER